MKSKVELTFQVNTPGMRDTMVDEDRLNYLLTSVRNELAKRMKSHNLGDILSVQISSAIESFGGGTTHWEVTVTGRPALKPSES